MHAVRRRPIRRWQTALVSLHTHILTHTHTHLHLAFQKLSLAETPNVFSLFLTREPPTYFFTGHGLRFKTKAEKQKAEEEGRTGLKNGKLGSTSDPPDLEQSRGLKERLTAAN